MSRTIAGCNAGCRCQCQRMSCECWDGIAIVKLEREIKIEKIKDDGNSS